MEREFFDQKLGNKAETRLPPGFYPDVEATGG